MLEPSLAGIDRVHGLLKRDVRFGAFAKSLVQANAALAGAAELLEHGQPCAGAARARRGHEVLEQATASLDGIIDARAAAIPADDPSRRASGDVGDGDTQVLGLRFGEAFAGAVLRETGRAVGAFGATCSAVAGKLDVKGLVTDVDDAAGLLKLHPGLVLAIPDKFRRKPVASGRRVTVTGVRFKDGSGIAIDVTTTTPASKGKIVAAPCLELRIAPIQPFPPYGSGPYTLHHPKAYAGNLEVGMRIGIAKVGCAETSSKPGTILRYFARVDVVQGSSAQTVAENLEPGATPVELPSFVDAGESATIKSAGFVESCKLLANGKNICAVAKPLASESLVVFVRERGAYASASYDKKTFTVADNGVASDWKPAKVTGLSLEFIPQSTNPTFRALGYGVHNNASSRPQVETIGGGEKFAVYADDFIASDELVGFHDATGWPSFELWGIIPKTGVDHRAALKWPRVQGTRSGKVFWYSARLPRLVRDALDLCASPPHAFYRLPFDDDSDWRLARGNWDDPGSAHNKGDANEAQSFSFDFMHDYNSNGTGEGSQNVRAARGGTVVLLEEHHNGNTWETGSWVEHTGDIPGFPGPGVPLPSPSKVGDGPYPAGNTTPGYGNVILIGHDDGTIAAYDHLKQDSVLVSNLQKVSRGTVVANSHNTGNSSTPHLHFDSHPYGPDLYKLPKTMLIRFQDQNHTCWRPKTTDTLASNNS